MRIHRLKKSKDFSLTLKRGRSIADSSLVIYYKKNEESIPFRVGFSVGKKVGKAVERNYYKRILREMMRKYSLRIKNGYDLVIIARVGVREKGYQEIENSLLKLLKKASLLKGDFMV
ncbi:MAG: ribonuclease P protein component [Thermicanus sp.]|nr:ribonuclease P protein component [Thermicanus sp.]